MGTQDIIVYVTVACCVAFMFRHYLKILFRKKDKRPECGCGCEGCPHSARTAERTCREKDRRKSKEKETAER